MSAVELVYDYFEDHVRASATVSESRPLSVGVVCFAAGGLSLFVAQALAGKLSLFSFSWTSAAILMAWKVAAGFILAALLHAILELQGIKGSVAALFVLFGMADLAWSVSLPLVLIVRLLAFKSSLALTGVFFGVGLLVLSLKARSLQDAYRISSGKAWFTLGLPYLAGVLGVLAVVALTTMRLMMGVLEAFRQ